MNMSHLLFFLIPPSFLVGMQRHPLDIPEILALVGTFLPLWVHHNPKSPDITAACFKPKTLVTCFRVSKLWHQTLLPILWYGYWSWLSDMRDIPAAVLYRNSHHLRILDIHRYTTRHIDLTLLNCTNLVDLGICVDKRRQGQEGGTVTQLLPERRILWSNPQLRTLNWSGFGGITPLLDAEDFVGLAGLEILSLTDLDCSNGRLGMALRNVAGSLKELTIERLHGIDPVFVSSPPLPPPTTTLSQLQTEIRADMDIGRGHGVEELILSRLESLVWVGGDFNKGDDLSLPFLVTRSPRLMRLVLIGQQSEKGISRLAESLGSSCPNIQSLELYGSIQTHDLEKLIRHCSPDRPQLRKLNVAVQNLADGPEGLVKAILRHASTLEDFDIYSDSRCSAMDASVCLHLLIECPRLTHFGFHTVEGLSSNMVFLAMLKHERQQEVWKCRETLQVLRLNTAFFRLNRGQTDVERQEKVEMLSEMGWEMVYKDTGGNGPIDGARLREVLELVRSQKVERLQMLTLDHKEFRRISLGNN
jgi:hypothetical protein